MSGALTIWSALEATPAEHAYEVEQERFQIEVGDRAADELAVLPGVERSLLTLLRIRAADRKPLEAPVVSDERSHTGGDT